MDLPRLSAVGSTMIRNNSETSAEGWAPEGSARPDHCLWSPHPSWFSDSQKQPSADASFDIFGTSLGSGQGFGRVQLHLYKSY